MKKRVADIIMETLADNGVEQAFCLVGGNSMYLNNALGISKRIHTIFNHHEQACAMAAEGYARYTMHKPALVCVTSGPGGTNALTGVMGAYVDSIPMIVVSGQSRYPTTAASLGLPMRCRGVQEFDIVNTVKTMTKYAKMVINPLDIRREVQKAYDIAMSGRRGPVWLDIPLDVQQAVVEEQDLSPVEPAPHTPAPTDKEITNLFALLRGAKRPLILAGGSIRHSGNHEKFLAFLEHVKIPVVLASVQLDTLHRQHALYAGICGPVGQRAGNFMLQNADVVLVLGAGLSFVEAGWVPELFAPNAHIIMVNIDKNETKRSGVNFASFIESDLKNFFMACQNYSTNAPNEWLQYKAGVLARFDLFEAACHDDGVRVNPHRFWQRYAAHIQENGITCLGNSPSVRGWLSYGNTTMEQRSLVNGNCGSMGDDLPLAIGAAAASCLPVFLQTGDGSFMLNMQELATIVHNRLPIKIALFSNGGYNALRNTFKNYFGGINTGCDAASGISFPSFEGIANAFGIPYHHCRSNKELDSSLEWLLSQKEAAILEVDEMFSTPTPPSVRSRLRADGTSEPALLQDMFPYIDRGEYKELMISEQGGSNA